MSKVNGGSRTSTKLSIVSKDTGEERFGRKKDVVSTINNLQT